MNSSFSIKSWKMVLDVAKPTEGGGKRKRGAASSKIYENK
jgi:hypothetical protein